jgi:hypothetical protein
MSEENTLHVETVALTSLKYDKSNARTHSDRNVQAIKASLTEFGQREPLVVHKGTVIAGNGRLRAMSELGWTECAVHLVPAQWTAKQARAYALAANRTAELAGWDAEVLLTQLESLDGLPTGFDTSDVDDLRNLWGEVPSLDALSDVIGDAEEGSQVRIVINTTPDVADMWREVLAATGIDHQDAAAEQVIRAAHRGVTNG